MKPSKPSTSTSSAATKTDQRTSATSSSAGKSDSARREGPARVADQLDRKGGWHDAAAHPGYQNSDQGGYRAGYDEAKFEDVERKNFRPADGDRPAGAGDDPPTKSPLKKDDRFQRNGTSASDGGGNKNK
jgi:hypothetical protein